MKLDLVAVLGLAAVGYVVYKEFVEKGGAPVGASGQNTSGTSALFAPASVSTPVQQAVQQAVNPTALERIIGGVPNTVRNAEGFDVSNVATLASAAASHGVPTTAITPVSSQEYTYTSAGQTFTQWVPPTSQAQIDAYTGTTWQQVNPVAAAFQASRR